MADGQVDELLNELIAGQKQRLLKIARTIVPQATSDDILQPNDFPELEYNADFRYEEGILAGMLAVQMAVRAAMRASDSSNR